uniref:Macro domain-containing protein n=1 Tax=Chromera velia CCMP2878 TaxID=1169474 RepID=A0A0G4HD65_9ALVE|eukprot:Cvel_26193.t1-p1 / transcript=Cvel_26193.t1 / gene=Cvel_26193 / organism=Chromera_velia_CCMP2878 / gene_product=O-acetyl-ADP-ribose deacetylase 1, putative / transcript_product=O-acetyl-ADP-ribose deacetylase 1, putative / location=Cvel_scaffold3081:13522-14256(+) / protein_length=245 / sequence_SO=supercontig / SO=protein_coding / is_pseudo=false
MDSEQKGKRKEREEPDVIVVKDSESEGKPDKESKAPGAPASAPNEESNPSPPKQPKREKASAPDEESNPSPPKQPKREKASAQDEESNPSPPKQPKREKEKGSALQEIKGDLFKQQQTQHLAHCISADCRLGKGIAKIFKDKFGGISELQQQKQTAGGCALLKRSGACIFNLVTKEKYWQKPTYASLQSSLEALRVLAKKQDKPVTKIAMPRIGCGLDGLEWHKVRGVIEDVFQGSGISVVVFTL